MVERVVQPASNSMVMYHRKREVEESTTLDLVGIVL